MKAPATPLTLEDVAPVIARCGDPGHLAKLRADLAALTPDTVIVESYDDGAPKRVLTMAALAREHQASAVESGERRMSAATAWGWAVSDLVFANFAVRK